MLSCSLEEVDTDDEEEETDEFDEVELRESSRFRLLPVEEGMWCVNEPFEGVYL